MLRPCLTDARGGVRGSTPGVGVDLRLGEHQPASSLRAAWIVCSGYAIDVAL